MKQEHIILIVLLLLLVFLIWKEIKRPLRAHLLLRITATVLAVIALFGLIVPPKYTVSSPVNGLNEVVLLTSGSSGKIPAAYSGTKKITTDPSLASSTVPYTADLSVFLLEQDDFSSVHILGNGLPDHEWKMLAGKKINASYLAPDLPTGFIKANWPQVIRQGDKLNIYGTYHHTGNDSIKIILSGIGTRLDSVNVYGDTTQRFQLHSQPAHIGTTIYTLQAYYNSKLISEEKVPVEILPGAPTKLLFLSSSPGFEHKFLSTWLYQNNYPAAIRNTVSQGKYDQQFLNMPTASLQDLTPSLLEKFDVLIADDLALSSLKNNEAAALRAQLNKGMGLILQTDSAASLSGFSRSFAIKKQGVQPAAGRSLILAEPGAKTKPLPAEQWFSIVQDPSAQALVKDEQELVLVSSKLYGAGRIILNTVGYTYSWVLSGNEENYSAFWSLLINKASRQRVQKSRWQQDTAFPTVDQPTGLVLEMPSDKPPIIKTGAGELYTTQTPYLPDTWTATWWPSNPGWQTLSCTDTVSMYVFEKSDWTSAKASELISRNTLHAAQQKSTFSKQEQIRQQTKQVPLLVFYIVLILSCTYLWWEGKRA